MMLFWQEQSEVEVFIKADLKILFSVFFSWYQYFQILTCLLNLKSKNKFAQGKHNKLHQKKRQKYSFSV